MLEPGNGGDIIIKGGTIEIDFDGAVYKKDGANPRKHKAGDRKLARIVLQDEHDVVKYDTTAEGENPVKWTVTVFGRK